MQIYIRSVPPIFQFSFLKRKVHYGCRLWGDSSHLADKIEYVSRTKVLTTKQGNRFFIASTIWPNRFKIVVVFIPCDRPAEKWESRYRSQPITIRIPGPARFTTGFIKANGRQRTDCRSNYRLCNPIDTYIYISICISDCTQGDSKIIGDLSAEFGSIPKASSRSGNSKDSETVNAGKLEALILNF